MGSQQLLRGTQWGVLNTHPILDGSTYAIRVANLFFHRNMQVFFGSTPCLPLSHSYATTAFSGDEVGVLQVQIHMLHSDMGILTLSSLVWFLIALM